MHCIFLSIYSVKYVHGGGGALAGIPPPIRVVATTVVAGVAVETVVMTVNQVEREIVSKLRAKRAPVRGTQVVERI